MALATTCPQCKTSFRVVPDQLKLRRGFVRCGQCRHVFAGIDHLRYVDDAQLRAHVRAAETGHVHEATDGDGDREACNDGPMDGDRTPSFLEAANPLEERVGDAGAEPVPDPIHGIDDEHGTDDHGDEWLTVGTPDFPSLPDEASEEKTAAAHETAASAAAAEPQQPDASALAWTPHDDDSGHARANETFARERGDSDSDGDGESAIDYFSTRRSRGFADRGRLAAGAVALVLGFALALQWMVAQRATLASRVPAFAPVLGAVLAPFGLRVGAPDDLDALTIESFELRASAAPDVLEMRALLRNRADHPVRWPSMRLTLTDRSNRVLVSRTLDPDDYLAEAAAGSGEGVPPRTEWPLRLALETRDLQPTGYDYRVRLFYP